MSINNKFCKLDPAPTPLVKNCFTLLGPLILQIINSSFQENTFPYLLKHAHVTPVIKDKNGNIDELKNYRPISNLPFTSKILEKAAYIQLNHHIELNKLHANYQSSYRQNHSCETAMFKVIGNLQKSIYENYVVALILLDSSAAFDTVDHAILLKRLQKSFLIKDKALNWIESYLKNRTFSVTINNSTSTKKLLKYGVPQGSLLGPLFYILYTKEIESIIKQHGMQCHMYQDQFSSLHYWQGRSTRTYFAHQGAASFLLTSLLNLVFVDLFYIL